MTLSVVPIVIDGPNFINRILEWEIDKDIIAVQITLDGFRTRLNTIFEEMHVNIRVDLVDFVCSKKLFGQGASKFSQIERDTMLQRLMHERGIHVEEVSLPGTSEKGVDTTVASMLETYLENNEIIFLISHDRDYVPVLRKLRGKNKRIYLIAMNDKFPHELSNEAYQTIRMDQEWQHFFAYSYPRYYVNKGFTNEQFRDLVSNADDRQHNQLRVDNDGEVYYSHEYVGAQEIDGVRFRFETLGAFNGYVGPKAASDKDYISEEYEDLVYGWHHGAKGYYDYPIREGGI
ncbi:MAG: NYN domain-containing protein [Syntrophales bacterium]|jgi:hypothetical protein